MACCGPNVKYENSDKLLKKLRSLDNTKISINLNNSKMDFNGKDGKWRSNLNI